MSKRQEGGLQAPTRHPIDWQNPEFYDETKLNEELERVFDICHGCRRCVSLCETFPTLFDLVDNSETMEVDGVAKSDYHKVVEQCYLCDLCYLTKCPYVPPHEWNVDFPHLMLRAKAVKFKKQGASLRDKLLSSTDNVGKLATIPVVVDMVNAANRTPSVRKVMEKTIGVHTKARLPRYESPPLRRRIQNDLGDRAVPAGRTSGKVVLFSTCYANYNNPSIGEDLVAVLRHNNIPVRLPDEERCCGMPKLELGDLESVAKAKEINVPELVKWIEQGWDIIAPVPSCVLMFKQELPLMFPDDPDVAKVRDHIYDPFEYLMLRHKHGKLNTEFRHSLGKVAYHAPCHQRVQRIGPKTMEFLQLVPDTEIINIERCSGHDGTYAVKREFHDNAMKIGRPVFRKIKQAAPDHYCSDCAMAAEHIANGLGDGSEPKHPIQLARQAYGI
ncbi:MAG: Fe-S oxidoreductase [Gammaproteobacteria bacterium]|nr:MAG: Fe-S oxidoreductase [Gammaproteobacteria bacterium]